MLRYLQKVLGNTYFTKNVLTNKIMRYLVLQKLLLFVMLNSDL